MSDAWIAKHAYLISKPPRELKKAVKLGEKISRLQLVYVREFLKAVRGDQPLDEEVQTLVFLWNVLGSIFVDAAARGASLQELAVLTQEVLTPLGLAELELRADLAEGLTELAKHQKKKKGLLAKLFSR